MSSSGVGSVISAWETIVSQVYRSVGETSGNFTGDYRQATDDLRTVANELGVPFEPPDYVRSILEEDSDT